MPELVMGPRDEVFLLSEDNGFRSRDEITLKKSADIYKPGTIVVEVAGKYEVATATNLDDGEGGLVGDLAIVARYADATEGDVAAAAVADDAEVKDIELIVDASLTVADLKPLLRNKGIKVRKSL